MFGVFNCRNLDGETYVLVEDYSIACKGAVHFTFTVISAIMIFVFALGAPVLISVKLRHTRLAVVGSASDTEEARQRQNLVARRMAEELQISDAVAHDIVRAQCIILAHQIFI